MVEGRPPTTAAVDLKGDLERLGLPSDKSEAYERLLTNDVYDVDSWTALFTLAQKADIEKARPVYERFLKVFPTAGRFWKFYAEHELQAKNYSGVEKIFKRCLLLCPNIELWKVYLSYLRLIKEQTSAAKDAKEEIVKGYEFALEHMGFDISATSLWVDYLTFLKEQKTNNTFEEGQKMTALRKLYQRAVENPMHNLEGIWKEYDSYENGLNKLLAKSLLTEHSPKYMAARSVFRERKGYYEGIQRNLLARPPKPNKKEHQVLLWKKLIAFEKTNPQRLNDSNMLRARVTFTYNQALTCLYHYPELWYEAASYQAEISHFDIARGIYDRALVALPNSLLLHFAYADYLESQKDLEGARGIYEKMVSTPKSGGEKGESGGDSGAAAQTTPSFSANPNTGSLVWIQYMRFERRNAGADLARKVFLRARKAECTYHVFVASAMMEFQVNKDATVARNIFELGMKRFGEETAFVMQYISFLQHLNEEKNLRGLFERVLSNKAISLDRTREIWDLYLNFEIASCAELSKLQLLDKRRAANFPVELEPNSIQSIVQRYQHLDLWPCSIAELNSFAGPVALKETTPTNSGKNAAALQAGAPAALGPMPLQQQTLNPAAQQAAAARFPRPDFSSMISYKQDMALLQPSNLGEPSLVATATGAAATTTTTATTTTPGIGGVASTTPGAVPGAPALAVMIPDVIMQLIGQLPPSNLYQGPILDVDALINFITEANLSAPTSTASTSSSSTFSSGNKTDTTKRKKGQESDSDDDDDEQMAKRHRPPSNDLYRARQAVKLSKEKSVLT